jgi:hypothetical protein
MLRVRLAAARRRDGRAASDRDPDASRRCHKKKNPLSAAWEDVERGEWSV